jgi:hypothetical protein
MEGVAGIGRPPPTALSGGAGAKAPLPQAYLPVENAPLRRKVKRAVRFPQLHRPLFWAEKWRIWSPFHAALHEASSRAMVRGNFSRDRDCNRN